MRKLLNLAMLKFFLFSSSPILAQCNYYPDPNANQMPDHPGGMEPADLRGREEIPYDYVGEKDVFWSKRIWREIDLHEKMNEFFRYEQPVNGNDYHFISILRCIVESNEDVKAYSPVDDQFTSELSKDDFTALFYRIDTIPVYDEALGDAVPKAVPTSFNPDDVVKYRLKEEWFFDDESSTMQVRIIGIAPIINVYDGDGNFRYSKPMFWVYYPALRKYLARLWAYNPFNDSQPLSWDDIFEMRFFSSVITKESNVYDRRIQDYMPDGKDALIEAERLKENIRDFEDDLWSH